MSNSQLSLVDSHAAGLTHRGPTRGAFGAIALVLISTALGACGTGGGGSGGSTGGASGSDAAAGGTVADSGGSGGVVADAAVVTPDAAVVTPDAAVVTPDAAVVTPDAAVVTPDAAVVSPDGAVVSPDAAVSSPDAAVVTPDGAVAAPDAAVQSADAVAGRIITVCPVGCDFALPSEAARRTVGGELVTIEAGDYVDCTFWPVSVTIRGINGRPRIHDAACGGKGIWVTQGDDTVIENVELSGMAVPDRNGAGIRHEGGALTVRNVYFHDGEEGILAGANPVATVTIEDSVFERLGQDGQAHGIYINQIEALTVRNSQFLSGQHEGHELKSRALRTLIQCSTFASLDGDDSRNIDLPNGGDVEIRDSLIEQGPNSANHEMVGFALEAQDNPIQRFVMSGTMLINDEGVGAFIHMAGAPEVDIRTNTFVGVGTVNVGGDAWPVNDYYNTRELAMLPAAPALPVVACGQ